VGKSLRRTAVFYKSLLKMEQLDQKSTSDIQEVTRTLGRMSAGAEAPKPLPKQRMSDRKRRQLMKRPDAAIYKPPSAKLESGDSINVSTDPTPSHCSNGPAVAEEEEDQEDSWDTIYDKNGECVRSDLLNELKSNLVDQDVDVKPTIRDYSQFELKAPDIDDSEFPHVLEIYDFGAEMKTHDLVLSITSCGVKDFDVQWVDDTHALAVFSNHVAAATALKSLFFNLKLRSISQAIPESRLKARRCTDQMLPYKARPETSASLARRLVTASLGLRSKESAEQRSAERKKLREAKEKRKLARKQVANVWEGDVN
jgi:hypothetical protein